MLSFPSQTHQQPTVILVSISVFDTIEKRTMIVNAAPLFATILCRWLGKFAMPIGDADSMLAGAIGSGRSGRRGLGIVVCEYIDMEDSVVETRNVLRGCFVGRCAR